MEAARCVAAVVLAAAAGTASAQAAFPSQPISLVVPFSAGSQPDILGRAVAEGIAKALGATVIVLNREGAAGTIAVDSVAKAKPDGHTIGFGPQGQFTIQPHLRKDLGYKLDSFEFLCRTNTGAFVIVAGPKSPYQTLGELIEAARKAPGKLNFASAGNATGPHLVAESLALEAGVKFTHVPFKNVGEMYAQTINGTVDFVATTPVVLTMGRGMKALAVVGDARLERHPEVPLLKDLGFKRATLPAILGVYAPKGLPAPVSGALRKACAHAVESDLFKGAAEKTATPGFYSDSPAYSAAIAEDFRNMGELLATLGMKAQ